MLVGKFKEDTFNFPLTKTDVEVSAVDDYAITTVKQTYYNNTNKRVNSFYTFPVYSEVAVISFTFEFPDGKIVCKMEELETAKKTYADAVSAGNKATMLSQQSHEQYDVHIGNIDSKETVIVTLEYLVHLSRDIDTEGYQWILPTTITPKYDNRQHAKVPNNSGKVNPPSLYSRDAFGNAFGIGRVEEPREEIMSADDEDPDKENGILYSDAAEDSPLNIKLSIRNSKGIGYVVLPKWNGRIVRRIQKEDHYFCELEGLTLGEDFVVKIIPDDDGIKESKVWAEKYDRYPDTESYTLKLVLDESSTYKLSEDVNYEFIIVIDRSGSMHGKQMENAKRALDLLLNSLPMDCYFNIYGFGSTWKRFYRTSVQYSKKTFEESKRKVATLEADMGGTEINDVLQEIYRSDKIAGHERRIILLTDGEVYDTKSIYETIKTDNIPVFTIGVGNSVSHDLVNGIAERTGGCSEVIMDADLIETKVMQQLKRSMYKRTTVELLGEKIHLDPGQEAVILTVDTLQDSDYVTISFDHSDVTNVVPVKWTSNVINIENETLLDKIEDTQNAEIAMEKEYPLRLQWAQQEIRRLEKEDGNESREKIIELSKLYNIVSKYTALVGVLETSQTEVAGTTVTSPLHPGKYSNKGALNSRMIKRKQQFFSQAMQWGQDSSSQSRGRVKSRNSYLDSRQSYGLSQNDTEEEEWINFVESSKNNCDKIVNAFSRALEFDGSIDVAKLKTSIKIPAMPNECKDETLWATLLFLAYMTIQLLRTSNKWQMTISKSLAWTEKEISDKDLFTKLYEKAVNAVETHF